MDDFVIRNKYNIKKIEQLFIKDLEILRGIMNIDKLFTAIMEDDINEVRSILNTEPELINLYHESGEQLLHFVAGLGRNNILEFILKNKHSLKLKDNDGYTPLDYALVNSHKDTLILLLKYGITESKYEKDYNEGGMTRLRDFVNFLTEGRAAVAQQTAGSGPVAVENIKKLEQEYYESLCTAIPLLIKSLICGINNEKYNVETLRSDLSKFMEVENRITIENRLPIVLEDCLIQAAEADRFDIVKILVEASTEVNIRNDHHKSPLDYAVRNDNFKMAKFLIESGARVEAPDDLINFTNVNLLSSVKSAEMFKLLIESGTNPEIVDFSKRGLLHYAVTNKDSTLELIQSVLKLYEEKGFDINMQDINGNTALHCAITRHDSARVAILLENGASVNIENKYGLTQLSKAILYNNPKILKCFVEVGIDITDNTGNIRILDSSETEKSYISSGTFASFAIITPSAELCLDTSVLGDSSSDYTKTSSSGSSDTELLN